MACVLLSNLMKSCLESLNSTFLNIDVYYWSDSAVCIYWVNNNSKIWKQFIQNRVIKIRDNLPSIKWLHCPGSLNHADIPNRGIDICKDKFLELWLNGPEPLIYSKDLWPPQDNVMCHSTYLITKELVNKGKTEEKLSNVISTEKFSGYDKVIRVYVMYEDFFITAYQ